jgi:hypothetical protein
MISRLPWYVAGAAVLLAAVLGWAYAAARREARELKAAAEVEQLKAKELLVAERANRAGVEEEAKRLQRDNELLKAEIERAVKLIPGARLDSAFHIVTESGVVGGEARPRPGGQPVSPRAAPRGRPRGSPSGSAAPCTLRRGLAAAGFPRPLASLVQAAAEGEPAAPPRGTGAMVIAGAPRAGEGEVGALARDVAAVGECVLAAGDRAEVEIDQVTLETELGNRVVVGTAKVNRLQPEPVTTLLHAKFRADGSRLVAVPADAARREGRGWGVGVYGAAWDGGQTVGPVVGFPSLLLLGHSLEAAVNVGVAPDFQVGALALARF